MPETSRREVRNLNALLEVSRALGAEMHLDNLLPVIIHKTTEVMDAERSSLFIYDPDSDELWSKVAEGMDEKTIRFRREWALQVMWPKHLRQQTSLMPTTTLVLTLNSINRAISKQNLFFACQ